MSSVCSSGHCLRQYCCPPCEAGVTSCSCDATGECRSDCASNLCARVTIGPNYPEYVGGCGASTCHPVRCPNFELCATEVPLWLLHCHSNRCPLCDVHLNADVVEVQATEEFECAVCYEVCTVAAKLKGCSHSLCVSCFKGCGFYEPARPSRMVSDEEAKCPLCRATAPALPWGSNRAAT
jgi:hypothetical protein